LKKSDENGQRSASGAAEARRAEGTFGDGLGAVIAKRETLLMTSLALMKE
jgi:hypothetical protein